VQMVPTEALLTVVLSAFALLGGAFYAHVHVLGRRIDDVGHRLSGLDTGLNRRIDHLDASLNGRIDHLDASLNGRIDALDESLNGRIHTLDGRISSRLESLTEQVAGPRAATAGLDARVTRLEGG
jgi:predicted PurR-regulated permease PerM